MAEVYHTPRDNMQQALDFSSAARLVQFITHLVQDLRQDDTPRPQWHADSYWSAPRD